MICRICGKEMDDNAAYCPHCYADVRSETAELITESQRTETTQAEPAAKADAGEQDGGGTVQDTVMGYTKQQWAALPGWKKTQSSDLPMRWFIMLPFLLGGEIAMFLVRGISFNSTLVIGDFLFFSNELVAIPCVILLVVYSALGILAIACLLDFRKIGITLVLSALAIDVVLNAWILYYLISAGNPFWEAQAILNGLYLAGSIGVLIAGFFYFKKREKLFL